jgi:hypothetical protein
MVIGILSDSHGRADTTRRAVEALRHRGAELLIHLGDIGDHRVIDELIGHNARIVFGNCDWDIADLTRYAEAVGVAVDHPLGTLDIGGRKVSYTHGHLADAVERAMTNGAHFLLHGHTHQARDEVIGNTRFINPGALFRAARYTAAVLDPGCGKLEFLEIARC